MKAIAQHKNVALETRLLPCFGPFRQPHCVPSSHVFGVDFNENCLKIGFWSLTQPSLQNY